MSQAHGSTDARQIALEPRHDAPGGLARDRRGARTSRTDDACRILGGSLRIIP